MGNQQNKLLGVEVKSRFTKEELHMLQKIYQDLSARSLNAISREVFMEFFPISGLWGERLFDFFDTNSTCKLTFEDFVLGLMACCKTSKEARIKLLFSLYDMNHDGCIEKEEVLAMLYNYPKDHIRDILDEVAPDKGTKLNRITEEQRKVAVDNQESHFHPILETSAAEHAEGNLVLPGKEKFDKTLEQFGLTQSVTYHTRPSEERKIELDEADQKNTSVPTHQHTTEPQTQQGSEEHKQEDRGKVSTRDERITQATTLNSRVKRYNSLMFKKFGDDRTKLTFEEFETWVNKHPVLLEIFDEAFYQKIWSVEKSQITTALEDSAVGPTAEANASQLLIDQRIAEKTIKEKQQEKSDSSENEEDDKTKSQHGINLEKAEEKKEEVQPPKEQEKKPETSEKDDNKLKDKKSPTKEEKEKKEKEEKERKEKEKKEKKEKEEKEKQEKKEKKEREEKEKKEKKEREKLEKKYKIKEFKREELKGFRLRYHSIKPVISGELFKLGKRTKAWKQRLYEVRDDFLFFYKKDEKEIPKRVVFLEGCYVEELKDSETTHKFGFKIGYKCETYPEYHIYSNTKAEMEEWIKVIKDQSNFMIHGRYAFKEKIGAGRYSFVYRAVSKIEPGREQAIRVVNKKPLELGQREQILVEVALIRSLSHPNIIKINEVVETRRYLYFVSDIAKGGDLFSYVLHNGPLEEKQAALVMLQLLQAVDYLHETGFIHRDIKPENILLVQDQDKQIKQIKISDFASAKFVNQMITLYETCGSANYTAPEVLWGKGYSKEIDTWSVGVIMYFILRGLLPFDAQDVDTVLRNTLSKNADMSDKFWSSISFEAKDLLQRLLEKDPKKRITTKKALEHSWFDLDAHNLNKAEEMHRETEDDYYVEEVFIIEDATPRRIYTDSPANANFEVNKPGSQE